MAKSDLRWRRAENNIKYGLIAELKEKPFSNITITSLIKTARISRRTFYLHYQDKYDLLEHLESDLFAQLRVMFEEDHRSFSDELENKNALWQQNYLFLNNVLTLIYRERALFKVLLSDNGDPSFLPRVRKITMDEIEQRVSLYQAHFTDIIPTHYAKDLVVDGLLSLIQAWLRNPHPESVEHFSKILTASQMIAPFNLLEKNKK